MLILLKEYKKCACGRPYFYLESLKRCPVCGKKLIFYGDLVNEVILEHYPHYPYLTCGRTLIEKIVFLGIVFLGRVNSERVNAKEFFKDVKKMFFEKDLIEVEKLFFKKEETEHFKDIMVFLKLFLKELNRKYRVIKKKEKNNELSEKDPFENIIIYILNNNYCWNMYTKFFDRFPVRSISREQILKKLQSDLLYEREQEITKYFLDHTIEETGKRFFVTRERIRQITTKVLTKLYRETEEYRQFEKIEKDIDLAQKRYLEAFNRYRKAEKKTRKAYQPDC